MWVWPHTSLRMGQALTSFLGSQQETFSKDELIFCHPLPEHVEIECPICLQVMLWEPYLVSCCGHHFCGPCIQQVKKTSNFCPLCKTADYQAMPDKGLERIIKTMTVKCMHHAQSCQWEGELQLLPDHLCRKKREGECPYAVVPCVNECGFKNERRLLDKHELHDCSKRSYNCRYCGYRSTYEDVTSNHLDICLMYPVHCPNRCSQTLKLPRKRIRSHLNEDCPLVDVSCDYKWAGCSWEGFRRDLEIHYERTMNEHLLLVSKETESLQNEKKSLKKEVNELRNENKSLKRDVSELLILTKKAASELRRQSDDIEGLKVDLRDLRQVPLRTAADRRGSYNSRYQSPK